MHRNKSAFSIDVNYTSSAVQHMQAEGAAMSRNTAIAARFLDATGRTVRRTGAALGFSSSSFEWHSLRAAQRVRSYV